MSTEVEYYTWGLKYYIITFNLLNDISVILLFIN